MKRITIPPITTARRYEITAYLFILLPSYFISKLKPKKNIPNQPSDIEFVLGN